MGADLFGSYVATVLAMVLGYYLRLITDMVSNSFNLMGGIDDGPILLPMSIAGAGIIISMIGTMIVKIKDNNAKESKVMAALNKGNITSIILVVSISSYFLTIYMLPETMIMNFLVREQLVLMRCLLCFTCRFISWWCYFFSNRILYWIR